MCILTCPDGTVLRDDNPCRLCGRASPQKYGKCVHDGSRRRSLTELAFTVWVRFQADPARIQVSISSFTARFTPIKPGTMLALMASNYDTTEFVDADFQAHKSPPDASGFASLSPRAPTREEVDLKVTEAQQKLAELKRAQEELERERAALEETRRRQLEFQTGRTEMMQHLTRGLELLEKAEFNARREAEQMKLTVAEFRSNLGNLEVINEEGWTKESFSTELSRALAAVENARMEWNSARLRFSILSGGAVQTPGPEGQQSGVVPLAEGRSMGELCKNTPWAARA